MQVPRQWQVGKYSCVFFGPATNPLRRLESGQVRLENAGLIP
jgi:hypothetical protein